MCEREEEERELLEHVACVHCKIGLEVGDGQQSADLREIELKKENTVLVEKVEATYSLVYVGLSSLGKLVAVLHGGCRYHGVVYKLLCSGHRRRRERRSSTGHKDNTSQH